MMARLLALAYIQAKYEPATSQLLGSRLRYGAVRSLSKGW